MTNINRLPTGLQDLLQSKSLGQNPNDLVQTVQPTIAMLEFYLQDVPFNVWNVTSAFNGAGTTQINDVADNEMWIVYTARLRAFPFAVGQHSFGFNLVGIPASPVGLTNEVPICVYPQNYALSPTTIGDTLVTSPSVAFPMFWRAGQQFLTRVYASNGNVSYTQEILFKKLTV